MSLYQKLFFDQKTEKLLRIFCELEKLVIEGERCKTNASVQSIKGVSRWK